MYCTVLYCIVLYCTGLYCIVLYCTVLYCTVLYCTVLYCIVLYCIVLYCTVLYCTVLYCTVLYCTVLYCTVLYCTELYCTVLYCTVLYCTVFYPVVLHCISCGQMMVILSSNTRLNICWLNTKYLIACDGISNITLDYSNTHRTRTAHTCPTAVQHSTVYPTPHYLTPPAPIPNTTFCSAVQENCRWEAANNPNTRCGDKETNCWHHDPRHSVWTRTAAVLKAS